MTTDPEVSGEPLDRRPDLVIWLLVAVMTVLAGLIAVPGFLAGPDAAVPSLTWFALVPVFAAAEVVVIHLPTQRNAYGHTLREIPAVLGLIFLAPQQYVTAYVVGAVFALVVAARMRGVKLAFNTAMFAFEAAFGALTFHAILQGGDPLSPIGWVAVLAAVLATDLISAGAVTAAISLTERSFDGEVLEEALRSGVVAAFINTCVALLVATLVKVQPSALPLLGVVVVLLILGYRVYMSLARSHAQTHLLYRFLDRTSSAASLDELTEIVIIEAADLMHAERAYLVELAEDRTVARCHFLRDGALETELLEVPQPDAWWWAAIELGVVQHQGSRPGHGGPVEPLDAPTLLAPPRDGLAALLRPAGSVRYVLVVCDRSFEKETFGDEDVHVFEALATHAGVAMGRARSVSALETLAKELEAARDAALAASEAKSMFLANMSHEIRTPLTTVLVSAELLNETSLDEPQQQLLGKMRRCGAVLLSLVESLLDFSRIEAGHTVLHEAEFDLHGLVMDVVDAHLARARRQGVGLEWGMDPGLPDAVVGDRTRVLQVVNNLVDNALKFTAAGRVDLEVGLVDGGGEVPSGVTFSVTDTGIGIREEDRAAIFESFSQVDGSATRRYQGTGLGLAICKQLTELMGGTITVGGELGVGSTFTVRLPLTFVDPAASRAVTSSVSSTA